MTSDRTTTADLFDPGEPRRAFAERLRAQFVGGRFEQTAEDGLERRALAPYLAAEPARPGFAAELRDRFVRGDLAAPALPAEDRADAVGASAADEPAHELVPLPARVLGFPRERVVAGVLALAAALALFVLFGPDGGTPWRVFNPRTAALTVDDRPFTGDAVDPGSDGCELCNDEGNLRLGLGDDVRIELADDSRVRLPHARPGDARIDLRIVEGEVVVIALGAGRTVRVETSEAFVTISDASASIMSLTGGGACICVREGRIEVVGKSGERESLFASSGERVLVTADGALERNARYDHEPRLRNLESACEDLRAGRFEASDYSRDWNVEADY